MKWVLLMDANSTSRLVLQGEGKWSSLLGRLLARVPPSNRPTQAVNHVLFIRSLDRSVAGSRRWRSS
jgi:hypothetical protein